MFTAHTRQGIDEAVRSPQVSDVEDEHADEMRRDEEDLFWRNRLIGVKWS